MIFHECQISAVDWRIIYQTRNGFFWIKKCHSQEGLLQFHLFQKFEFDALKVQHLMVNKLAPRPSVSKFPRQRACWPRSGPQVDFDISHNTLCRGDWSSNVLLCTEPFCTWRQAAHSLRQIHICFDLKPNSPECLWLTSPSYQIQLVRLHSPPFLSPLQDLVYLNSVVV